MEPLPSREEVEKTPYPCKEKYEQAEIQSWTRRHLEGLPDSRETPSLVLLLGGSGAGKGTFIDRWREAEKMASGATNRSIQEFVFHGLDEYLQYVPEYQRSLMDPSRVFKDAADGCYGGAAIPAAKATEAEIVRRRIDTIYEETGKNPDRIKKRVLPPFVQGGYRITVVLVHNDAAIAIERSKGRFQRTGRYAPEDYIRDSFKNNLESYKELKQMDVAAEFIYCDNFDASIQCWRDGTRQENDIVPAAVLRPGEPQYRDKPASIEKKGEL